MGVDWNSDANLDVPKLLKSWRQGEFVVRYGRCPGCIRDAAETKKKGN